MDLTDSWYSCNFPSFVADGWNWKCNASHKNNKWWSLLMCIGWATQITLRLKLLLKWTTRTIGRLLHTSPSSSSDRNEPEWRWCGAWCTHGDLCCSTWSWSPALSSCCLLIMVGWFFCWFCFFLFVKSFGNYNNKRLFMAPHLVGARSTYQDTRIHSFYHTCTHTHTCCYYCTRDPF